MNLLPKLSAYPIILGSQSPRRQELLNSLDLDFQVVVKSIDESLPSSVSSVNAAEYIALEKLKAFQNPSFENHLVITADTIVVDSANNVLGKPIDLVEAKNIVKNLSGKTHHVYTGVGILFNGLIKSFTSVTEVTFANLSDLEIDYYIEKYKPFDKAGSYGIQEWIGRIGVKEIVGSYENVMGLPTNGLYEALKEIENRL